jgi:hypothetical protein
VSATGKQDSWLRTSTVCPSDTSAHEHKTKMGAHQQGKVQFAVVTRERRSIDSTIRTTVLPRTMKSHVAAFNASTDVDNLA